MSNEYFADKVIKKPNDIEELTDEQHKEFIKCALDFNYWAKTYAWVQGQQGECLFNPRTYQSRIIKKIENHNHVIVTAGRQSGKSQMAILYILHQMIFFKNFKAGVTSYTLQPNLKDLSSRFRYAYENLVWWMKPAVREYNQYGTRFSNGSSVIFQVTKENTFRGLTLDFVMIDELSHVKPGIAEEFFNSLFPSIMAAGEDSTTRVLIVSTPNGTTGVYARLWIDAVNKSSSFVYDEVKYHEIPGRTPKFEKTMLKTMSKNKFLQEFKCAWISDKGTLINSTKLESIKSREPLEVINEDLWLWTDNLKGKTIALACDVSDGIGQDFHAIQIVDVDTLTQIGEFRNNLMTQTRYAAEIVKIMKFLFDLGASDIYYNVENNGTGAGVINLLHNMSNPVIDRAHLVSDPEGKKLGLAMTRKSKPDGCGKLKDLIESDRFHIQSDRLLTELKFFVKSGVSFKAESGMHDDLAMSMVLMMLLLQLVSEFEESAYETFNELDIDIEQESYEVGIYF